MRAPHKLIKQALAILLVLFSLSPPSLFASLITSPNMGETLDGGAQVITWDTSGQTVEQWAIYAGSSLGAFDYFVSGNVGHATSTTIQFLPVDGSTVFVRLWLKIAGVWMSTDVSYSAAEYTFSLPPGSLLASTSQNLTWITNGGTITQWALYAGSSPGNFDYHVGGGANASNSVTTTVSGLPTDSSTVYFQLWMQVGGYWEKVDVSYVAVPPRTVIPVDGSNLLGTTQHFIWLVFGGAVIVEWQFYAGSSPGGFDYYIDTGLGSIVTTTATGLPDNGSTVYVTLWLNIEGNWEKLDLTYTAFEAELIDITQPTAGQTLDGPTQQFIWDPQGQSIDSWVLYMGSFEGANDYHISSGLGTSTSSVVSNLPTDGSTIYARLWYQITGEPFLRKIDRSYTAAPVGIVWDRTLGNNGADLLYGMLFEPTLNRIYAAGQRHTAGVIVSLNPNGTTHFETTFDGTDFEKFNDIATDGNGNFYAAGRTRSNDGDITDGNNGLSDALLVKYDSNGVKLWDRTIGGSADDEFNAVAIDASGNIYAAGYSESSDGDITDGNFGGRDGLLVKFDSNGTKLWDETAGGNNDDEFNALAFDASGNIFPAGYSFSSNGSITINYGFSDGLVMKFDSSSASFFAKSLGGSGYDRLTDITFDSSGNIYVSGITDSNDVHITDGNNGGNDALLMQLNPFNGTTLWDKTLGGSNGDEFYTLVLDSSGNIYAAGLTLSNDGDISDGNNGDRDALLMKFDNSGNLLWNKTTGGSSYDDFSDLALGNFGAIYGAGATLSNDGDITDGNAGNLDELIIKYEEPVAF